MIASQTSGFASFRARGRAPAWSTLILLWMFAPVSLGQDSEGLYSACAACHGADGSGNAALGAPALAGQLDVYLERQLHLFRKGLRGSGDNDSYGAQMQPFAQQLADDATVKALARYLADMPNTTVATAPDGADPRRGANLYNGNCGACHGAGGSGNAAMKAPRLTGIDSEYLARQFINFRDGLRGSDPSDRLGRQMAMMARTLPDEQALYDILAYLAGHEAPAP